MCWAKTQAEVKEKLAKAIEESKKLDIVRSDEYTVARMASALVRALCQAQTSALQPQTVITAV